MNFHVCPFCFINGIHLRLCVLIVVNMQLTRQYLSGRLKRDIPPELLFHLGHKKRIPSSTRSKSGVIFFSIPDDFPVTIYGTYEQLFPRARVPSCFAKYGRSCGHVFHIVQGEAGAQLNVPYVGLASLLPLFSSSRNMRFSLFFSLFEFHFRVSIRCVIF